jgi:DNA repair exonuclease SbcCD ATPase subunit
MAEELREQEMEKLKREIASLREELAALAAGGPGRAKAGSSGASDAAAPDQAGTDWEDLRQTLDEVQERGEKALKDLSARIERHPVGSAVAAFGLGFLIARLLGGGRRS